MGLSDSRYQPKTIVRNADFQNHLTEQLDNELNHRGIPQKKRPEVMNFGISTYGTMQERQTLRYDVWRFAPHLILFLRRHSRESGTPGANSVSEGGRASEDRLDKP
jgi:hypothetical protein